MIVTSILAGLLLAVLFAICVGMGVAWIDELIVCRDKRRRINRWRKQLHKAIIDEGRVSPISYDPAISAVSRDTERRTRR